MRCLLLFALLYLVGADVGTFLQYTDIHYDMSYQPGSPANCYTLYSGLPCCRNTSIKKDPERNASEMGDLDCDLSYKFIDESLQWASQNLMQPDFIMRNGDDMTHHITLTAKYVAEELSITNELFERHFPKSRVIASIGNHDTFPLDQLWYNFNETFLSKALGEIWYNIIPNDQRETFRNGGYYIVSLNKNTRMIVVNSLYYDVHNIFAKLVPDPSGQNKWLYDTLTDFRARNLTAWIMGHIPIGTSEANKTFTDYFYNLCAEFSDVIKYQFWGHSHEDYYFLILKNNSAVGFSFATPGLLADHRFSSFREYIYDRDTMEILDYREYVANLTTVIATGKVTYDLYYTASIDYGLKNFTAESYYDLYKRFLSDDKLFQGYYLRYVPGFNSGYCDDNCKQYYMREIIDIIKA